MGSTSVRTCDWPMPRVLRTGGFLIHIHGCALPVSRANLTLLFGDRWRPLGAAAAEGAGGAAEGAAGGGDGFDVFD